MFTFICIVVFVCLAINGAIKQSNKKEEAEKQEAARQFVREQQQLGLWTPPRSPRPATGRRRRPSSALRC